MKPDVNKMNFKKLVDAIQQIHDQLSDQACRAVNASLTLRNWLIGLYIQEYEQNGADRAQLGSHCLIVFPKSCAESVFPEAALGNYADTGYSILFTHKFGTR